MRRLALYLLVAATLVAALVTVAPRTSTNAAVSAPVLAQAEPTEDGGTAAPVTADEDPTACVLGLPDPTSTDAGFIVITTEPRTAGVQVSIDGASYTSDSAGCIVAEVTKRSHVVTLPRDADGEQQQTIDGKVRPVRGRWDSPVLVGNRPLELEAIVDPPVCALRPPQAVRTPGQPSEDTETSLIAISIVPRTPDVRVAIDGREYTSDLDGCVVIEVAPGRHQIVVPDVQELDETTRFVFGRWDDIWDSTRTVTVGRTPTEMQLGIKIQHPVRMEFFDSSMNPLDVSRIQTAKVVNSFGEVFPFSEKATEEDEAVSFDEIWLTANRLRRVSGGLFTDDNVYVYGEVTVDDQNVVQSGEIDYIPSLDSECPELSSDEPQRCNDWRVRLLLFPFQVELRSFIFRNPVDADVEVYLLNELGVGEPVLAGASDEEGWVTWPQVPRGDYEILVATGGITTSTPTIVTGPKVESITVMTNDVLWFVIPVLFLLLLTIIFFFWRPRWRLGLLAVWMLVVGFALSVPTLGAAVSRPLSASVKATYSAEGAFVGIDSNVNNKAPVRVEQSYCAPDFELRVPTDQGIWRATYESHDFHDVEMSKFCRIHIVDPGTSRQLFSSTQGQEWFIEGELPPPGIYEAFVRVFDIPAGSINLDLRNGLAPFLTFGEQERIDQEETPFTNPFED